MFYFLILFLSIVVFVDHFLSLDRRTCSLQGKGDGLAINASGLNDNWDDPEGRYCKFVKSLLLSCFLF